MGELTAYAGGCGALRAWRGIVFPTAVAVAQVELTRVVAATTLGQCALATGAALARFWCGVCQPIARACSAFDGVVIERTFEVRTRICRACIGVVTVGVVLAAEALVTTETIVAVVGKAITALRAGLTIILEGQTERVLTGQSALAVCVTRALVTASRASGITHVSTWARAGCSPVCTEANVVTAFRGSQSKASARAARTWGAYG